MTHRRFNLVRDEDVTGLSGTGIVAEGVAFTDGVVVLRWVGKNPTSVVWHDGGVASVEAIHGHNGKTRISWLDGRGTSADDDALDALESMVEQYLATDTPGEYDHMFMSAGEEACEELAAARPWRWEVTPIGVRLKGDA